MERPQGELMATLVMSSLRQQRTLPWFLLSAALGKQLLSMTAVPKSVEVVTMRIQSSGSCFDRFIKQDVLTTAGQYLVTKHGNVPSAEEAYVISF